MQFARLNAELIRWRRGQCICGPLGDMAGDIGSHERFCPEAATMAIERTWEEYKRPDVIWAPTGLDRIHVPTGTVWKFAIETRGPNPRPQWVFKLTGSQWLVLERHDRQWIAFDMGGWDTTELVRSGDEGSVMQKALDAAGWKP